MKNADLQDLAPDQRILAQAAAVTHCPNCLVHYLARALGAALADQSWPAIPTLAAVPIVQQAAVDRMRLRCFEEFSECQGHA